jgi:hypothetical protein
MGQTFQRNILPPSSRSQKMEAGMFFQSIAIHIPDHMCKALEDMKIRQMVLNVYVERQTHRHDTTTTFHPYGM